MYGIQYVKQEEKVINNLIWILLLNILMIL